MRTLYMWKTYFAKHTEITHYVKKRSTFWGKFKLYVKYRSSLFHKTSAKHERHECDTNNMSATRMLQERHECNKSAKRTTRVRNEWKILILITTRIKTYFHNPILYIANERFQAEGHFNFKNYLLTMPCSHAKMSAPQQLNFVMRKTISKSYTLNCSYKCPCSFPHSYV